MKCKYHKESRRGYWVPCRKYDSDSLVCNHRKYAKKECRTYWQMRYAEEDIIFEKKETRSRRQWFSRLLARIGWTFSNPSDPDKNISITDKPE